MADRSIILAIDHDSRSLNLLTAMLCAQGHHVRTAASGEEGLDCVRSQRPAVILVAVRLPGMDGFEFCRRLKRRERSRDIPLLFITTSTEPEEQIEGLRLGAADFICKPFRQEEVIARVMTYVELGTLRAAREHPPIEFPYRTAAAEAQRESDRWISLALEAGRMYAYEWDPVTDKVLRSHHCAEILGAGIGVAESTGQTWFQHIHPDDLERFIQVLALLSPAFDTFDMQYRVIRSDGRIVAIRETSRAFFDTGGRLTRLIGIVADVTEQQQAEKVLEQSRADLRQLIQKVPIGVAFADERGRIQFVNDRFVQTFGYRLDEIAEPEAWWESAYPDGRYRQEVMNAWDNSVQTAAREDKDIAPRESRVTCKDGTIRTVEIFGATLGDRKLILFDDVTERKRAEAALRESEERFRAIADTAPIMLWVSGPDKLCTFFNKGWLAFTGRTLEQELGNGWVENVHPDDVGRCVATYSTSFDARKDFQMEYRLRRADGEYRWILDTGTPRYTPDGAFAGYIGSGADITEVKRNQEHMLATQKLESLGVLASGIAHDFNNLLGCILADADGMMMELDSGSPARDGLQRIETVAIRASEIVRQIMAYAGQEQEDFEQVDISQLVQEMLHLLRVCIPKSGALKLDLPADLPPLRANAAQIRQVVMNLLLNAAEALGEKKGVITITGRRERIGPDRPGKNNANLPEGDYISLEVSDTGSGMREEIRTRIFDPFFTTKFAGRGLGLAAVQGIVRSHGGTIDVTSTAGEGTTFQILLPCDSGQAGRGPTANALPERFGADKGAILVVEDEDTLRISVARMLRKKGFSVLEASDGNLAVDLIRAQTEDIAVVLLDLTLPGKSSHEVFEELRRARPGAKVILTSAYGRESVPASLTGLQHENFIRKPYHLSELVSAVRNALPPLGTLGPKRR